MQEDMSKVPIDDIAKKCMSVKVRFPVISMVVV